MKTNLYLIVLGIIFSIFGCNDCHKVDCRNGGTCDNGTCICPDGFYGNSCETQVGFGNYFLGNSSQCSSTIPLHSLTVFKDVNNSNTVTLSYQHTSLMSKTLIGTINDNTISFSSVTPTDSTLWITSASGVGINPMNYGADGIDLWWYSNLSLEITVSNNGIIEECTVELDVNT